MWRKMGIFILIVFFIAISGCTQIVNPQASQTKPTVTPTPPPPPKYSVGDIIKNKSADNIGMIITDYDLRNRRYSVRTIIYDGYGRISYIKEIGGQSVPFETIESSYPLKTGKVDNPLGISEISYPSPKFGTGSIHREDEYKNNGIIILSYDYSTDMYTYASAYYEGGGKWNYDPEAKQSEKRAIIENRYDK